MKKIKYLIALVLALLIAAVGNVIALATPSTLPDLSRKCSISITLAHRGTPMVGGEFTVYRVADARIDDGALTFDLTDAMHGCGIDAAAITNSQARLLYSYALQRGISGTAKVTDSKGKLRFASLTPGIYLVAQTGSVDNFSDCSPFVVRLPYHQDNTWRYTIDATPKTDVVSFIDIMVTVYWDDDIDHSGDTVTVCLYNGDILIDTVILNADNDWTYTWHHMPSDGDYRVVESDIPDGYEAKYSSDDPTRFVIVNSFITSRTTRPATPTTKPTTKPSHDTPSTTTTTTRPSHPTKPNKPDHKPNKPAKLAQTGQLNWPIPLLSGLGILLIATGWYIYANKRIKD